MGPEALRLASRAVGAHVNVPHPGAAQPQHVELLQIYMEFSVVIVRNGAGGLLSQGVYHGLRHFGAGLKAAPADARTDGRPKPGRIGAELVPKKLDTPCGNALRRTPPARMYGADGVVRRVNNGLVDTCYVDVNGDLLFTGRFDQMDKEQSQEFVDEHQILFSLAFGPVLIENGKVVTPDSYAVGEINDHYPRSALCQLGKLHYLLAVVNAEEGQPEVPTIHRFAWNLRQRGVQKAYALDGGQTAVIAMDGQLINAVLYGHQRKISDIIYFATAIPGKSEEILS